MRLFGKSKRKEQIEEFARQHDMIYLDKDEYGIGRYFKGFKLFGRGGGRGLKFLVVNTLDSTEEQQYGAFDYQYIVSTGTTTMVFIQTVFFWLDRSAVLPQLNLFPEKWYHKWGERFGMQDIDFTIYPEFSDKFVLQSEDPDFTSHIFQNDALIAELKEIPNWTIEAEGYYMIMYIPTKQQQPEEMAGILACGNRINSLLRS